MTVETQPIPRPGWDPLPHEGDIGVIGRVLVREWGFFIAELRFSEHATIHEHPSVDDHIVTCIQGEGFTSIGDETVPIREEQQVRFPKDIPHRLWTENSTMTILVFDRLG
jgi:quercetin dioxygenase-like cupin family protein